jgi:hypothetical protein
MLRFVSLLALLLVVYLAVHATRSVPAEVKTTRIAQILAAPDKFDGKSVTVGGVVTGGVGLMGVGGFHVRDSDGRQEIFVLSGSGVPPAGSSVTISGIFREAATIGSYRLPVIILNP